MQQEIYGGRYRVIKRIGEGGMAFVYLAMDEKLGRKVAIKVLHEHMERNSEIRQRFQMEAQAISGLDHPNIVKIYDFSGSRSDRLWIVTEVIKGYNLAEFIQRFSKGWMHSILAACIVQEICKALEKAHSQGIIHRDIKPENIMLTSEGRVKLMDFGIAKDLGKASMTVTGTFMGSPSYMSPEQIRGRHIDSRSDIYSLSVLFYEVITGRLPFTGNTTHDVVLKIVEGQFTHPKYIVPGLADAINQLIINGMSRDPAARQQTINEYNREIGQYLGNMGFDESHIELERFFKDRKNFEQRLALLSKLNENPTRTLGLPPTPVRKARSSQAARSRYEQASLYKTSASSKAARSRHNTSVVQPDYQSPARNGKHRKSKNTVLPPSPKTVLETQAPPPSPVSAGMQQRQQRQQQQQRVPKAFRQPQAAQRRRREVFTQSRSNTLISFLGVLMVSAVITVSVWGFWQLQLQLSTIQLSQASQNPNSKVLPSTRVIRSTSEHPEQPTRVNSSVASQQVAKELPPAVQASQDKNQIVKVRPESTAHKRPYNRNRTASQTRVNRKEELAALQSQRDSRSNMPIAIPAGQPADASTEKVSTPEPIQTNKSQTASIPPTDQVHEQASDRSTEETISYAWMAVSSEPAAEVFIDGQRLGTTVDKVSQSDWLKVQANTDVTLTLKRSGYKTHSQQIRLGSGSRKQLRKIRLERTSLTEPQDKMLQLTIATNRIPSTLKVENLDDRQVKTLELLDLRKSLALKPGNYLMIIEYNGQKIERRMNLTGQSNSLIFSAMFKD